MDSTKLARKVLVKTSAEYAAQRFDDLTADCASHWGEPEYLAALEGLPEPERGKALQLALLTGEWFHASEARKAEIDPISEGLIAELDRLGSRWFVLLIDIYAPTGTALREEYERCCSTWGEVHGQT